jgi:hypothetical protein
MRALTQYVRLAERHWRAWLPRRVAELERRFFGNYLVIVRPERGSRGLG